jgi:hypothetical protein
VAKYVLLAIADDDEADWFVELCQDGVLINNAVHADKGFTYLKPTVRAVFKKPTQFCTCTGKINFTRGKKYGWWVHAGCGKPTIGWVHGDMWYTVLGTNLLPIQEGADENRGPGHKQHEGYK